MPRAKKLPAAVLWAAPEDVEQQFYEALREGDLEKLMAVWAEDEEVVCIHPGGPRLVGLAAVRAAFEATLSDGGVNVQPQKQRRTQTLTAAVHSVVEQIQMTTPGGPRNGYLMATNVYLKTGQGWRMVMHHASPGGPNEPAELIQTPAVLH